MTESHDCPPELQETRLISGSGRRKGLNCQTLSKYGILRQAALETLSL